MPSFLLVALGSAAGGALRYAVSLALPGAPGQAFPWATFVVNAAGCFTIGALSTAGWARDPDLRLFLTTGLLGGFTTFSAFGLETVLLAHERPGLAAVNVAAQVGVGLLFAAAGRWTLLP